MDFIGNTYDVLLWSNIELLGAIICGSAPTLKVIFIVIPARFSVAKLLLPRFSSATCTVCRETLLRPCRAELKRVP